jgi:hypothetical protein
MKSIRPSGFYIIRKPSRPINIILDFFDQTQNTCCEVALKSIFEEKYLQEAMYVTSQSLFHEFQGWIRNNNPVKKDRLKSTLLKYLIRTSSRATPFGMFSGCLSIGRFSSSTEIHFNNYEPYTKYRRLNVECLCRMSRSIISLPNIKYQIKFYPNNSLYRIANKYRYTYCLESQPRSKGWKNNSSNY